MKAYDVPLTLPADVSWSDPAFRETMAEDLRRQRYALAGELSSGNLNQTFAAADRINARLAVCDAVRMCGVDRAVELTRGRNNILAKEIMVDHIEEAAKVYEIAPDHCMLTTFLAGTSQCADHAWALRRRQEEQLGPFGGLQYMAWLLSRPEAKLTTSSVPSLFEAVEAARNIEPRHGLHDWRLSDVKRFMVAWRAVCEAAGIKDLR